MSYPYRHRQVNGRLIDEHRLVMEQHLGRRLGRFELVHHINGNKKDNRLTNLQVVTPKEHAQEHGQQKHPLTWVCAECGTEFTPPPTKRGGLKQTCSKACRYARQSRIFRNPAGPRSKYRATAAPSEVAARRSQPSS